MTVIIFVCITSIISGITTGIIVVNGYKGIEEQIASLSSDEDLGNFLEVYSSLVDEYYEDIDTKGMLDAALNGMLEYLGDDYTTFMNSDETSALDNRLSGTYRGIGVEISGTQIVNVLKNTPAEEAGLLVGDVFSLIDGEDVSTYSGEQIALLIKENKNDVVKVTVIRNGAAVEVEINIKNLVNPAVDYSFVEGTSIGYIYISVFSENVGMQVSEALKDLESQGMTSLIIDVRDNTGGYLDGATDIASLFLEKGKLIYSLEYKNETEHTYDKTGEKRDYKVIILQNANSASASEVLTAALQDNGVAQVVGTKSFGKGKVQQTYKMENGSMAKFTSAEWLTPKGICIDGEGIAPDYEVELEYITDEAGNKMSVIDTQLNKAVEILSTN